MEIITQVKTWILFLVVIQSVVLVYTNDHTKRLYDHLFLKCGYNNMIPPNGTSQTTIKLGLILSQLIDVDEQNQIMTTNVWVLQEWWDYRLEWDPTQYDGVDLIYRPADEIWHPDIVLYNTGDGKYEMTTGTKATITSEGKVTWKSPASFKSSCTIDVTYFPFDEQHCGLIFGSWTYNLEEVEIYHLKQTPGHINNDDIIPEGIDLTDFYVSVEWDVMNVTAFRGKRKYAGSEEYFREWNFEATLKRKFLFYTVNLIIPLVSHAFITVMVFYLPADSKEKVSLSINILLSLTVFFLMLAEIIPPTSVVVPLLGKYLVFTLVLVALSVIITAITYNVHFRSSATHNMPDWVRKIFLYWLPRMLMMRRPKVENSHDVELKFIKLNVCPCFGRSRPEYRHYQNHHQQNEDGSRGYQFGSKRTKTQAELMKLSRELDDDAPGVTNMGYSSEVQRAIDGAIFIANHLKRADEFARTREDWKYVALVIDRMFLWIYCMVCVFGTIAIICQAPMLYDTREPIVKPDQNRTSQLYLSPRGVDNT